MRILALATAIAFAVGAAPSTVLSQEQRKDGGSGTVKGQSEHPTNPKQAEPESSSHNADKPKDTPTTTSPSTPGASPEKAQPDPKKK
jgi:hypothetical protein